MTWLSYRLGAVLLAAAVSGCWTADRLGECKAARPLHLAPDAAKRPGEGKPKLFALMLGLEVRLGHPS